jgi:CTP:molybdopterin cytidylyltransferase MocA
MSEPDSRVVPIVLAAGASSRMGRPKALLDFDGRCALELVLDAVGSLAPPIVVLGPNRAEVEARVRLDRVAVNPDPASGQTASLRAGLALLPADAEAFLFLPVDVALVTRAHVARLLAAYRAEAEKSVFVPSHAGRRGHPVLCRRGIAGELLALPAGAPAREAVLRDPGRVAHVVFDDAYTLMDMDSPADYEAALAAWRSR